MALLSTQVIVRSALTPTFGAISASDTFLPNADTFLYFKVGGTGATITFVTPRNVIADVPTTDYTVVLPSATTERVCGPFPAEVFADPTTGLATYTSSAQATITVACIQLSV